MYVAEHLNKRWAGGTFRIKMKYAYKFLLTLLACSFLVVPFVPLTAGQQTGSLFKVTLIAPATANLLRRQWTLITANSFQAVGIDARTVAMGWAAIFDRVLYPPVENLGKTFDDGGYDIEAIGWTPGLFPLAGIMQIFYGGCLAPSGSNYYLWQNATNDALIQQFMGQGYTAAGMATFKQWQHVAFEDVPKIVIVQQSAPMVANPALDFQGYEWLYDNVGPVPQFIKTTEKSVVFAQTGEIVSLIPPMSNSWYDTTIFNPIVEGLFVPDVAVNMMPQLATSFTMSADGSTFTYNLRHGVLWHDGVEFNADDVLFSYMAALNPLAGAANAGFVAGYVGEDVTFKWLDGSETRLVYDPNTGEAWYPAPADVTRDRKGTIEAVDQYTVKITIPNFAGLTIPPATFHPESDNPYIIPMHVFEDVPFEDWATHPYNTGTGEYVSNGQTFTGPMGTGAYMWVAYDDVAQTIHLKKNANYWNKTQLEAAGMFGIEDYYIKYIVAKDAAIAALKNGEADILDQNYQMQNDVRAGTFGDWASVYLLGGTGLQEFGFNMRHPILGTGTATPLGASDPTKAAYAARCVRQALDYLVPKQLIIDNLLAGFGVPGATHVAPTNWGYDNTVVSRSYDPNAAKSLLAAAGYQTGVAPPSAPAAAASYIVGMPIPFSGRFIVDPVIAVTEEGFVVLLQQSTDNATWTNVAQGITTTGGYYSFSYAPTAAGTFYFRVSLPGVGAVTARAATATGPDFPYATEVQTVVGAQVSASVRITIATLDSLLQPIKDDVSALETQVSNLQTQLATVSSQLSSLNTLTWGLGGLIVIVAAGAWYLSRKKAE